MPQQTITYNGYEFTYNRLSLEEETVYADDDFTQVGTRYTFHVSGHVVAETVADMREKITCMRARLHVPRKNFKVQWTPEGGGGSETFWTFGDDGARATDNDDWGPRPGTLNLEQFAGGRAAVYSWSVSVTAKECADSCLINTTTPNSIRSISRTYEHSIDANGFTTRTIRGTLTVGSMASSVGRSADFYRYFVTPKVPINFRRVGQSFVQSPDGRRLDFSFTDAEMMWTLPDPVTEGTAEFMVHMADFGAIVSYRLSGKFAAPASVTKTTILQKIFDLINAKFPLNQQSFVFEDKEFSEDVYGNSIAFSISATSSVGGAPNGTPDYAAALNPLTIAPPNSDGRSHRTDAYGGDDAISSGIVARAAKPYDACSPTTTNPPPETLQGSSAQGDGITVTTRRPVATNPGPGSYQPSGISNDHQRNPIVAFHEVYSYEVDNHIVVFPVKAKATNVAPRSQQTAAPTLTVIQAGYLRQYAKSVNDLAPIPKPVIASTARILSAYLSPASPVPVGDGSWNLYSIEWRYVLSFGKAMASEKLADAELQFPKDLRRSQTSGEGIPQSIVPSLVRLPTAGTPTP
jgi:hypothetical protein